MQVFKFLFVLVEDFSLLLFLPNQVFLGGWGGWSFFFFFFEDAEKTFSSGFCFSN